MANFPGSIFAPTVKVNGQGIDAGHINDLQDEVAAIESGLRSGTAPINSSQSTLVSLNVTGASTRVALDVNSTSALVNIAKFTLGTTSAPIQSDTNRIFWRVDVSEASTQNSSLWTYGAIVAHHVDAGAVGNRAALVADLTVSSAADSTSGNFAVALTAIVEGRAEHQSYFGANPYARATTGASSASIIGMEVNTDNQSPTVVDKIGIQIADVATSTGVPTGRSQAIRVVAQSSAVAYLRGLVFDNSPAQGVRTDGILIASTAGSYGKGIDFGGSTFTGAGMVLPHNVYYAARDSSGGDVALLGLVESHTQLGGGLIGHRWIEIPGSTDSELPAEGSTADGLLILDRTNNALIVYSGGKRRRLAAGSTF